MCFCTPPADKPARISAAYTRTNAAHPALQPCDSHSSPAFQEVPPHTPPLKHQVDYVSAEEDEADAAAFQREISDGGFKIH